MKKESAFKLLSSSGRNKTSNPRGYIIPVQISQAIPGSQSPHGPHPSNMPGQGINPFTTMLAHTNQIR
jgi:hypothetical protein